MSRRALAPVVLMFVVIITEGMVGACARPTTDSGTNAEQQCVQAVFGVLSGMVTKPYDDQVFQDFVTRYGTSSAPYTAYRDSFASFNDISHHEGVRIAEDRLRAEVTRDCAAAT